MSIYTSPGTKDLYLYIDINCRYCCKNMGRDIPKSAVMKIVEQMCIDGMCYSTIDEEHYSKI